MDAKEVLEQTKKHHFWILCAVVLITGSAGWYMAVSDLSAKTQAEVSKIKSSYTNAQTVVSKPEHPNPAIATEVEKLVQQKKEDVYWGWAAQYQKQQDLVVWPDIDPVFNKQAKDIKYPFELMKKGEEPLTASARGTYKNYMDLDLPRLADIIKSNWSYSNTLSDSSRGVPDAREGQLHLVYWEPEDQERLVRTHFEPVTRGTGTPTTLQIAYAQEDFWVLSELLKIIANTNEKTAGGIESTIRTLDSIALGRTAIADVSTFQFASVGQLPAPVSTVSTGMGTGGGRPMGMPGGMPGMPGGMPGMMPGMMPGGMLGSAGGSSMPTGSSPTGTMGQMPGGSSMPTGSSPTGTAGGTGPSGGSTTTATTASDDPADNRYVDNNFKPLPAAQMRTSLEAVPATAEQAALAVAKRIPVRIRVRMDQRRVADLLAECANGKLPVEVRQWRINPQSQTSSKKSRRAPSMNTMGMPSLSSEGSERDTTDSDDMEVLFELYGLVYLYNPANAKQLNLDKVPEKRGAPTAATPVAGNQST